MNVNVQLQPQEESTHAQFSGPVYTTSGFQQKFGNKTFAIAVKTMIRIGERVKSKGGADYLQVAWVDGEKFWVIDDGINVTCLLPEEY
ncbi:hypothetical protein [Dethiobacter alkaliphilus]|uniref:Uncharacterized protein n=1 Tax=Dethiobacter alkaliphilus AHT 1 TaxID=555088 RepID=C0GE81_DETAL|nr:hypothetical protein [Dethiobacter alkaliphilus]EEG78375.1 hypothetical protein DealDRAFT_0790 [Dethiobacter alkaliphilus AHT 1]